MSQTDCNRALERMKKEEPLIVELKEGVTSSANDEKKVASDYFSKMFHSDLEPEIENISPKELQQPFPELTITKPLTA